MDSSTNLDQVESATSSISNVKTFATTFLIITLSIGAVVLFVINLINVRERKYEIGVLRTIGMKKSTLTGQFLIELLIVSFVPTKAVKSFRLKVFRHQPQVHSQIP